MELLFFGGPGQRRHAGLAALDHRGHFVKIPGADFLLVRHKGVAALACSELGLLHLFQGIVNSTVPAHVSSRGQVEASAVLPPFCFFRSLVWPLRPLRAHSVPPEPRGWGDLRARRAGSPRGEL